VITILTASNWDGSAMGKTIALKLTKKEEQVVIELNKQGISNSELLRNALCQYCKGFHEASIQDRQKKTLEYLGKNTNGEPDESFSELKQEIQKLWEQMDKTQRQIDTNINTIQRQMYLLSVGEPSSKPTSETVRFTIVSDVHQEVDEFLKELSGQSDL
jgi:DNA-directed RNA polymerase subunit F